SLFSFRFLAYNPIFARSHLNFIGSLSDSLIEAGHEVEMMNLRDAWHGQCNFTLYHQEIIEELIREKYDGAFSEPICMCGFALFNHIGITNYAVTLSIASSEGSFETTGAPSFPSYVPGIRIYLGEKMNFFERIHNSFNYFVLGLFVPGIRNPFDAMFKQRFGLEFPNIDNIINNSSFFFVNSEPLIDFPKITTHKLIDIGGIGVSSGHQKVNETWSEILNRREKNVLISFGTVAKSYLMPDQYKKSIIETARNNPDVTFIWKYEKPEHRISQGIDNLVEATWIPQNDMLCE
ncbi:hypothetical protein PFISCL1PPCAC_14858, partial [Pristionchus fissidentatus]